METSKKWYRSKTLWFNAVMGILGTIATLATPEGGLSPVMQKTFGTVVLIGNGILRFLTDKPIE